MDKYEDWQIFVLASILDPQFKLKWCTDNSEEEKSKAILIRHAQIMKEKLTTQVADAPTSQSELSPSERSEPPPCKKRNKEPSMLLSYPASPGPMESLFSIVGKFFRPKRCKLTDNIFENLKNINVMHIYFQKTICVLIIDHSCM